MGAKPFPIPESSLCFAREAPRELTELWRVWIWQGERAEPGSPGFRPPPRQPSPYPFHRCPGAPAHCATGRVPAAKSPVSPAEETSQSDSDAVSADRDCAGGKSRRVPMELGQGTGLLSSANFCLPLSWEEAGLAGNGGKEGPFQACSPGGERREGGLAQEAGGAFARSRGTASALGWSPGASHCRVAV